MVAYPPQVSKSVRRWLRVCLALVFLMVAVGGLTRLTGSGLSIAEWKLVTGMLPPQNPVQWLAEFQAYKATPEYRQVNHGIAIEQYQNIYWLEYIHRLLGRITGLAFALPLLWFGLRREISPPVIRGMLGVTLLVAAQGALGWYMVQSGLVDTPRVAPLQLAAHLGMAALILATTLRLLLMASPRRIARQPEPPPGAASLSFAVAAILFCQLLLGAMVAGMKAGLIYNSFPLMGGAWMPGDAWALEPWHRNLFENAVTVQFLHRWTGVAAAALIAAQYAWLRRYCRSKTARRWSLEFFALAMLQVALGIGTLLAHVPLVLASLHQMLAIIVFCYGISLYFLFSIRIPPTKNRAIA